MGPPTPEEKEKFKAAQKAMAEKKAAAAKAAAEAAAAAKAADIMLLNAYAVRY